MMSSGLNPTNANDSTMPGDYESWSPPQPMVPSARTPFPRLSPTEPTGGLPGRTSFPRLSPTRPTAGLPGRTRFPRLPPRVPTARPSRRRPPIVPRVHHIKSRRHRRRPLTPEIVIERQSHCHSSRGRHHVITVPLDNRPTLGLRGPPKRVLEIERVRCHRRRRSPSICYEYDYDYDNSLPPPVQVPVHVPVHVPVQVPVQVPVPSQPPMMVANPIANPFLSAAQASLTVPFNNSAAAATSAFLSNLSQEVVDNLPRQTVHLPPIHLPGSQADANTELHTVSFPAEIINPIDGTLSIIQANPTANNVGAINIQSIPAAPVQPQFINIPTTVGMPIAPRGPLASPVMSSDPLTHRLQELFQRLRMPQTQPISSAQNSPMIRPAPNLPMLQPAAPNPSMIRPTLPTMSQFDPGNNIVNNPPTIPSLSRSNLRSYPSSNIQPTNPLNIGSYRPVNATTPGSFNNMSYHPANITPSGPVSNMSYRPANITPSGPVSNMSYRPSTFTQSGPVSNMPYRPSTFTQSGPVSNMPYRPSTFTPSAQPNNATYRPYNTAPSNSSDIGPYQPANITPYGNITNRSTNNPVAQSSFASGPTAYSSAPSVPSFSSSTPLPRLSPFPSEPTAYSSAPSVPSLSSSTPFPRLSSFPSGPDRNSLNPSTSSLSFATTPNQSFNSTPKSILRNTSSIDLPDTTYTRLNLPNDMSSNDVVRKTTRFS